MTHPREFPPAWIIQGDLSDPILTTDGKCPFCHEPLGDLPTDSHPYFGIQATLGPGEKNSPASVVYECQGVMP